MVWKKLKFDDDPPAAHKDTHDPIDGSDKLDTAAPVKVGSANAIGSSHSLARADHVHEREHAIYTHPSAPPCRAATAAQTGHATATQIAKLDGIEAEANKYVHPTTGTCPQDPKAHTLASHSTKAHAELTGVTSDQHHPQAHTLASHSTKAHSELTGVTASQHHTKYVHPTTGTCPQAPKAHESTHVAGGLDDIDSALAIAAMANLSTGKAWKGVANRPVETNWPEAGWAATNAVAGDCLTDQCTVLDLSIKKLTGNYEKMVEIVCTRGGTFRIKFELKCDNAADTVYGRIYRNGGAVGTEQSRSSTTWITKSEDIAGWSSGDLLQLYLKYVSSYTRNGYAKNLRVFVG